MIKQSFIAVEMAINIRLDVLQELFIMVTDFVIIKEHQFLLHLQVVVKELLFYIFIFQLF